jgi:hypothetical protein
LSYGRGSQAIYKYGSIDEKRRQPSLNLHPGLKRGGGRVATAPSRIRHYGLGGFGFGVGTGVGGSLTMVGSGLVYEVPPD